ncbi:MAG: hypothetical protein R3F11_20000 [Verrucomicrobiales bacterium]
MALAAEGEKLGTADGQETAERLTPEVANIESLLLAALAEPDAADTPDQKADAQGAVRAAFGWAEFVRFHRGSGKPKRARHRRRRPARLGNTWRFNRIQRLGDIALTARSWARRRRATGRRCRSTAARATRWARPNCIRSLGDIALYRSERARGERYGEALPIYSAWATCWASTNCIQSLGDIALPLGVGRGGGALQRGAADLPPRGRPAGRSTQPHFPSWRHRALPLGAGRGGGALREALPIHRRAGVTQWASTNCIRSLATPALRRSELGEAERYGRRCRSTAARVPRWERPTASKGSATSRWKRARRERRAPSGWRRWRSMLASRLRIRWAGRTTGWRRRPAIRRSEGSTPGRRGSCVTQIDQPDLVAMVDALPGGGD